MTGLFASKLKGLFFVGLVFFCSAVFGAEPEASPYANQTFVISGTVSLQDHNPRTGRPYEKQQANGAFVVTLSGNAWKFCVTNVAWPRWHAEFVCDGTNSYTILPFANALLAPFAGFGEKNVERSEFDIVMIEPSPRFLQRQTDNYGVYTIWITYGLSPQWAKPDDRGLVEIPLSAARQQLGVFGYNWEIEPSVDGRFAKECKAVREQALDLKTEQELRRVELDYPESAEELKEYRRRLIDRRQTPDGFVKLRYNATEWRSTNGVMLPVASETKLALSPWDGAGPWRVVTLRAAKVSAIKGTQELPGKIERPVRVQDYRYKRANEKRIFKYSEYSLKPGDAWKPANDPTLLAEAEKWLKNGEPVDPARAPGAEP